MQSIDYQNKHMHFLQHYKCVPSGKSEDILMTVYELLGK